MAALLAALLLSQTAPAVTVESMRADVDRLVRAAENLTGLWPSQPPPPIREVDVLAAHGKRVAPLLIALLTDDPNAESDPKRWKMQQQISLALSRIYSQLPHCGRIYCDGDPKERIRSVKAGWLQVIAADADVARLSSRELLDRFIQEKVFWRQLEMAKPLAVAGSRHAVITELEPWLTVEDRHLRGNAALVLGLLGDPRGFETIAEILTDRSERSAGQGFAIPRWTVQVQIRADRYYAAHLLGVMKDSRGVELLISLLNDQDVGSAAPWSLAQIGDGRAIRPLVAQLDRDDASARVLAISALEQLNAEEALPKLQELLRDNRSANFGNGATVAEAARRAIAVISQHRPRE